MREGSLSSGTNSLLCAALLLALAAPNVEIVGISAVHGNVVSHL